MRAVCVLRPLGSPFLVVSAPNLLRNRVQLVERRPACVCRDVAVLVDEDRFEQCAVQAASRLVRSAFIESLWCVEEAQRELDHLHPNSELVGLLSQLTGDLASLELQLAELGSNLVLRHEVVGGQIEQADFLGIDLRELLLQVGVRQPSGLLLVSKQFVELGVHLAGQAGVESEYCVVLSYRGFYSTGSDVREVADLLLPPAADVVVVDASAAPLRLGVDQARGAPGLMAAIAEHQSFQVVEKDAVALAGLRARLDDLLNPLKRGGVDQCRVAPGERFTLVGDHSGVIGASQDLAHFVNG